MVSMMVQSNNNGMSSNFFVEQKCCLVKHAYMFWPLLLQQPWNTICSRYKWHWRFKSSGILSLDCLTLKVKAMHSFDLSVATYQSKESNIYLQTCIFNTATTSQILQVTLLILILHMLRTALMQTFVLNEYFTAVAGWAAYQPKQNGMQHWQFVNYTSLSKTECQRFLFHILNNAAVRR